MKKSTLVFRSLGIIILLAGVAHLFSFAAKQDHHSFEDYPIHEAEIGMTSEFTHHDESQKLENKTVDQVEIQDQSHYDQETDYIIDKWKVSYKSEEFTGSIIYDIKKEGKIYNAYTYQYLDENGYAQEAEGTKTLIIKSFDGYKGKGVYKIEYEGENYDIDCQIDTVDEHTFKLSYDYYGYSDTETWKRQK